MSSTARCPAGNYTETQPHDPKRDEGDPKAKGAGIKPGPHRSLNVSERHSKEVCRFKSFRLIDGS